MKLRFLLALLFITFYTTQIWAQYANVRGFLYEKATGEPVIFTTIFLKGTQLGAATDVNGYFSITKIPAGNYKIVVYSMGYDSLEENITVSANEIVSKKYYLNKTAINLKTVDISAERTEYKTDVKMSVTKVTPKEISKIPSVGGEPDLAQYLQVVPGVIFSGDQGGQLYIRGGTPIQNKVLLDGMVIYNPFHSIGLFSVFDTDIIANADVFTGGFPAQYGGRISAVMDVTTRDGNKKRLAGKLSVNPFASKLTLEGPLIKQKETGGSSTSFVVSYKNSYLNKTSDVLYKYVNDEAGLPYSFNDIYAKVSINGTNGSKLNVFGFNFNDKVDFTPISEFNWKSTGFGTKFIVVPNGSSTLMDGVFAYSKYKMQLKEADDKPRTSEIGGFNMGLNFTYFFGQDELKYGLEVLGFKTDFEFYNAAGNRLGQEENTTEFGTYLNYRKVAGKFVIQPGLRLHYYSSLTELAIEPRFSAKYNATDFLRFKLAAGIYKQNFLSATSDRDVVNFFYGFLSAPENLPANFNGSKVDSRLQQANHFILGTEIDLPHHFSVNIEGYIKDFAQVINVNRNKIYDDVGANSDKPDELKKDFIVENGIAKGIDFNLKYEYKKVYLWFVYSIGFVDRFDGNDEYMPSFDRRHNVNIVASYTFGKDLLWELNSRLNYGSGFPFTPTQGFYPYQNFSQGVNTNYNSSNGQLGIIYGELNANRLPDYARLDLTLKRTFVLSSRSNLEATASVINLLNRQNIFYFNRVTFQRVDQLPILPALGVSMTF
ncbi:MAG: TonB-dependent receptor [Bacteroidia bacterium]|nr:TonB-dependent receptor [Bacteroidia bacterium]